MVKAVSYLLLRLIYSSDNYTHDLPRNVCEENGLKEVIKRMGKLAHEDECKSLHSWFT